MAYVVARPGERFEIRESVHTAKGPRARSLANFARLTGAVLEVARARATRPFDTAAVVSAAARLGAPVEAPVELPVETPLPLSPDHPDVRQFVQASRRMADTLDRPRPGPRPDPGASLIELLGFAEQITSFQPPREGEPLTFPLLARLAAEQQETSAGARSER